MTEETEEKQIFECILCQRKKEIWHDDGFMDVRDWIEFREQVSLFCNVTSCICDFCMRKIGSVFPFKDQYQRVEELKAQIDAQAIGLQNVYNKFDELVKKMDLVLSVRNDPETLDRLEKIIELMR